MAATPTAARAGATAGRRILVPTPGHVRRGTASAVAGPPATDYDRPPGSVCG